MGNTGKGSFPFEFYEPDISSMEFKYIKNKDVLKEYLKGYLMVGPKRYCIRKAYKDQASFFYNFEVRPDDIWIVGYPRSGTTISEELIWLLCNNLDYGTASKYLIGERVPYLDLSYTNDEKWQRQIEVETAKANKADLDKIIVKPNYEKLAERKGRRIIKTHLPLSFLPPDLLTSGCKVFYLARDSRGASVSAHHAIVLLTDADTRYPFFLPETFELFYKDMVDWTPHLEHVKEGWENRNRKNVCFVFYEDLIKKQRETFKRYAKFLEKELSEDDLDKLIDHFGIDNFRKNKMVNNEYLKTTGIIKPIETKFIRKGKVEGWKEELDEEQIEEADKIFAKRLENSDLKFPAH